MGEVVAEEAKQESRSGEVFGDEAKQGSRRGEVEAKKQNRKVIVVKIKN